MPFHRYPHAGNRITAEEWQGLHRRKEETGRPVTLLVAEAIRQYLVSGAPAEYPGGNFAPLPPGERRRHRCQAATATGRRCERLARYLAPWSGGSFFTCYQHREHTAPGPWGDNEQCREKIAARLTDERGSHAARKE